MRIIYLHQYFSTRIGGTRSYEMAKRLVRNGHDVHMVTSDRDPDTNDRRPRWYCTDESGIQVHWARIPYSNHMDFRERVKRFTAFAWFASHRAASLRGDLVFASSTPLTVALPAVYAARRHRIPMVFEVRDLWPEVPIAMGALKHPITRAAAGFLRDVAYREAARVVALSPDIKSGVVARGYPEGRVAVIPNACDLDMFDVGPAPGRALREQHAWLENRPLVVYTGALGRVNGVSYLARLAAEVSRIDPEVRFVTVGGGREESVVRGAAEQLGVLGRNFFMLPSVPKHEIAAWLSAADIATSVVIDLPELWANSANKIFDALAAGKPVAINHLGWQADLFRETRAGLLLDARDLRRAATTLVTALRDRLWLDRAGAAARRLARGPFNRDHLAAQLEQTLTEVAHHGTRPRRLEPGAPAAAGVPTRATLDP